MPITTTPASNVAQPLKRHRRPLERPNLVNAVVRQLQNEILDGPYPPGTVLPSEGALSKQFGVSRTVLREAMRILVSRGLVTVSQGRVARVRAVDPEPVVDSLSTFLKRSGYSPLALLEVRRSLETEAAALAAMRATPEHIAALETAMERHAQAVGLEEVAKADVEFHERLAEATENPVFLLLQRTLAQLMKQYLVETMSHLAPDYSGPGHAAIVAAIKARDAVAARESMIAHLQAAETKVKGIGIA